MNPTTLSNYITYFENKYDCKIKDYAIKDTRVFLKMERANAIQLVSVKHKTIERRVSQLK